MTSRDLPAAAASCDSVSVCGMVWFGVVWYGVVW